MTQTTDQIGRTVWRGRRMPVKRAKLLDIMFDQMAVGVIIAARVEDCGE